MSYQQFKISSVNPNDNMGGGGCICDARQQTDCKPPYVVFYGNDMESALSPYPVLCAACARAAVAALDGEVLEIGERNTIPATRAVQPLPARREPPVVESPDPKRDFADDAPDI